MKLKQILIAAAAMLVALSSYGKSKYKTIVLNGEEYDPDSILMFSIDDVPDTIGGYEVMSEYAPMGIEVIWTGKKFKTPKAGKVKYSKKEGDFIATSDENPCGLKVSINKKTGKVSGSFKLYVMKSEKKLKSYSFKITGVVGGTVTAYSKKVGTIAASLD